MARLKDAKRQKNQLELAFGEQMTSEAWSLSAEGTEASVAKCRAESLWSFSPSLFDLRNWWMQCSRRCSAMKEFGGNEAISRSYSSDTKP